MYCTLVNMTIKNNQTTKANLHIEIDRADHEKLKKMAKNSKGLYTKSALIRKAIREFIERVYKI